MKNIVAVALTLSVSSSALASIEWKGDLRYRFENSTETESGLQSSSYRDRIRARIQAKAKVNDSIEAAIRLATGGQSATSTNQTLDSEGANKALDLDLAYGKVKVADGHSFTFGKMKTPVYKAGKSDLIFDGDLTPEGIAYHGEFGNVFINASRLWMTNNDSDDVILYAPQAGVSFGEDTKVTVGGSFYKYTNADYAIFQGFADVSGKAGGAGWTVYSEFATNTDEAATDASSYLAGLSLKFGDWSAAYDYRSLAADTTNLNIVDGDSCGGKVACNSSRVSVSRKIQDNLKAGLTAYAGTKKGGSDIDTKYTKYQVNLNLNF